MESIDQHTPADTDRAARLAELYARGEAGAVADLLEEISADGRVLNTLLAACAQIEQPPADTQQTAVLNQRAAFVWASYLFRRIDAEGGREVLTELVTSTRREGRLDALVYALLRVATDVMPDLHTRIGEFDLAGVRYARLAADAAVAAGDDV